MSRVIDVIIIPDIPQTALHKHGKIASITPDIPQTSLHKNRTITQITADIPQTSLHKHGTITKIILICVIFPCLCNEF
jgi:hypothetical protein